MAKKQVLFTLTLPVPKTIGILRVYFLELLLNQHLAVFQPESYFSQLNDYRHQRIVYFHYSLYFR